MNITIIPLTHLALSFIPVVLVFLIFLKWNLNWKGLLYACSRMLVQLLAIGYVLTYIFNQDNPWWTIIIIIFMLSISSWISLHSIKENRSKQLLNALMAMFFGATPVLLFVTMVVIPTYSWYNPAFFIPLAGMVYSKAMNSIGLSAERVQNELKHHSLEESKKLAFNAALIPEINTFLAVGLVSLPGMMTGQILSGVDPLIAVRYQIVVMTMVLGSGGLSAAIYLKKFKN